MILTQLAALSVKKRSGGSKRKCVVSTGRSSRSEATKTTKAGQRCHPLPTLNYPALQNTASHTQAGTSMVFIKSTNWARVFKAMVWSAVWLAFLGVVYIMAYPLKDAEPVIFAIVMLVAIVGSISFPYVRHNWQRGARWSALVCAVIGVLCIGTHAVLEGSFWSSIIDKVSQENARVKAVNDANGMVLEKRKERYANSSVGLSPAQLAAEIEASKQNERWSLSSGCTKATSAASRDFCTGYWSLQAKLAAAKDADNIESSVWHASTTIETAITRNFAALALLASNATGYDVQSLTLIIVALIVICVQAVLAGALFVGFAPEVIRKPVEAAKASEPLPSIQVVSRQPREPMKALSKIAGIDPVSLPVAVSLLDVGNAHLEDVNQPAAKPDFSPDPDGTGGKELTPKPLQDNSLESENDAERLTPATTVVTGPWEKKAKPVDNAKLVQQFVRDRLDKNHVDAKIVHTPKGKGRQSGGTPGSEIYEAFCDWCEQHGHTAIEFGPFGKLLTKHVKKARNHKRVYYAAKIIPTTFIEQRKVAFG